MVSISRLSLVIFVGLGVLEAASGRTCFAEQDGNVVIQAEDTNLTEGWNFERDVEGYSGRGYISWSGMNEFRFEGKEKLAYRICVDGGNYRVNVVYTTPVQSAMDDSDLFINVNHIWRKMNIATRGNGEWKTSRLYDAAGSMKKSVVKLDAGCHEFEIAARKEEYSVDKYILVKTGSKIDVDAESTACEGFGRLCGASLPGKPVNEDNPVYVVFSNPSDKPARLFQYQSGKLNFVKDVGAGSTISLTAFELDMFVAMTEDGDCMRSGMMLEEGGYRHDGEGYASFSLA